MREIDEFDSTQVQDFRSQIGDLETNEQVIDEQIVVEEVTDETGEETNE
jgi:hypothetical protein